MRPARKDEVPAFGSIWQWRGVAGSVVGSFLMAVGPSPRTETHGSWTWLWLSTGAVNDDMIWSTAYGPMEHWVCIQEAQGDA